MVAQVQPSQSPFPFPKRTPSPGAAKESAGDSGGLGLLLRGERSAELRCPQFTSFGLRPGAVGALGGLVVER